MKVIISLWKKIVFVLLFISVIFPANSKKNISLLIPGVEQIRHRRYVKGIFLATTFVGFTLGAILKNRDGYKYYDLYKKATDPDSAVFYRKKTEESFKDRNFFILGAVGVWVIHMLDLKFSGRKKAAIGGGIEKGNLYLGVRFSF